MLTRSPLATLVPNPREAKLRKDVIPWGVCLHTTGSGVLDKAQARGISPLDYAVQEYLKPDEPNIGIYTVFPHYVVGNDGKIVQIADEKVRARHVAIDSDARTSYASGQWKLKVSKIGLGLWMKRWPNKTSPLDLCPDIPNECYIGVECVPLAGRTPEGSLFTDEQYKALSALLCDVEKRYDMILADSKLVGHEDLSPMTRWNSHGGWDPGACNPTPSFFWNKLTLTNDSPASDAPVG